MKEIVPRWWDTEAHHFMIMKIFLAILFGLNNWKFNQSGTLTRDTRICKVCNTLTPEPCNHLLYECTETEGFRPSRARLGDRLDFETLLYSETCTVHARELIPGYTQMELWHLSLCLLSYNDSFQYTVEDEIDTIDAVQDKYAEFFTIAAMHETMLPNFQNF